MDYIISEFHELKKDKEKSKRKTFSNFMTLNPMNKQI